MQCEKKTQIKILPCLKQAMEGLKPSKQQL